LTVTAVSVGTTGGRQQKGFRDAANRPPPWLYKWRLAVGRGTSGGGWRRGSHRPPATAQQAECNSPAQETWGQLREEPYTPLVFSNRVPPMYFVRPMHLHCVTNTCYYNVRFIAT
jgi:hypothetical protein